jgi:hypothetical protein
MPTGSSIMDSNVLSPKTVEPDQLVKCRAKSKSEFAERLHGGTIV